MTDRPSTKMRHLGGFLARLSLPAIIGVGMVVMAGVGSGGYYAYQTYDYVQHDNDFCMSCHLMELPYEQFAESAHRGLGCKACHQPSLVERSAMALTQFVENPEEISEHAVVPNERCAECHIEGDPEKWRLIANSVGHRVHFESDEPDLDGLLCVECHATGLHEFSPVDRTCGQSGCHEDNTIKLGAMSDLTIHCAACHNFVAPVPLPGQDRELLDAAFLPDEDECLSCHVMRSLVQMPDPDPHSGACASCHNPHEQEAATEAAASCATAQCHANADTLTAFHEVLAPGTLADCVSCHQAHEFRVDGTNCLACHADILEDSPAITLPSLPSTLGGGTEPSFVGTNAARAAQRVQESPAFLHREHRDLECGNCHSSAEQHGGILVATLTDCRTCHHTEPVSRSCARCHDTSDTPPDRFSVSADFKPSVGPGGRRALPFEHTPHQAVECATCHTEGIALGAETVDCLSCHEQHHDPDAECAACHQVAPVEAHPPDEAHVTCSGSGCHTDLPFEGVPRTREVCLVCHQDLRDHRPERPCSDCHTLPAPRRGTPTRSGG